MNQTPNFIQVATFTLPAELAVIRGRLEAEGIETQVKDELLVQTHNYYSNAIGGIKLLVRSDQVELTHEILESAGYKTTKTTAPSPTFQQLDAWTAELPGLKKLPFVIRFLVLSALLISLGIALLFIAQ